MRLGSLRLVGAFDFKFDLGAEPGGQHHHAHDALGVDAPAIAGKVHFAGKAAGQLGEFGGGARVQAEFVIDLENGFDHGRPVLTI